MKALALVASETHVCVRYRLAAFRTALAAAGHTLELRPLAKRLLARLRQYQSVSQFDAVILQRTLLSGFEIGVLKRNARRLIFDFDDAIWQRDSYSTKGSDCRRRSRRFANVIRSADRILAGNAFLADHAERIAGRHRVQIVPSCIEPADYPQAIHARRERLTLVWVGSSSTLRSLEAIRLTLEAIGRAFPNLRLKLLCDRFAKFDPLIVEEIPWSAANEARELAESDIGIAWMPNDDWSRGKCGVKVLQYLAAGLPVIANPVGIHSAMVQGNGFLASTTEEWIAAIRQLHDPSGRERLGANGRKLVEDHFSIRVGAAAWQSLFDGLHRRAAC